MFCNAASLSLGVLLFVGFFAGILLLVVVI
jgi:hypothetical protein